MTPTANRWRRHVDAWQRSGLTRREYAERHDLNPRTLSWWRWKLAKDERLAHDDTVHAGDDPEVVALSFVEVEDDIAARESVGHPIEILAGGLPVRVSRGFDGDTFRRVVEILEVRR